MALQVPWESLAFSIESPALPTHDLFMHRRDSPPTHGATAASIAKQHRDQSAGERVSCHSAACLGHVHHTFITRPRRPPVPRALARHPGQRLDTLPRVHDAVRLPVAVRTVAPPSEPKGEPPSLTPRP